MQKSKQFFSNRSDIHVKDFTEENNFKTYVESYKM